MPFFDSFMKDWKTTKDEMEKLGTSKPAETKTFRIGFIKIETRVSSGIGESLRKIDKALPKDESNPTEKELGLFADAVKPLRKAVESELNQIEGVVKSYKASTDKLTAELKDGYYRSLKVFKAKLLHYVAAAEAQLVQYQTAADKKSSEVQKSIQRFKAETKERFAQAISTIKNILLKPSEQDLTNAHLKFVDTLNTVKEQAEHIDLQMLRYSNVLNHSQFNNLYLTVLNWNGARQARGEEGVKVAASALAKFVKEGVEILSKTGDV